MQTRFVTRRGILAGAAALPMLRSPAQAARTPGLLRFGLSTYPPTLTPWANAGTATGTTQALMNRGLLGYAPDGTLVGELAESWSREGNTWIFRLRDAAWHNGKPVESGHIKWNFDQIAGEKSVAYIKGTAQDFAGIETPDARTVRITTKQPNATLPFVLATYFAPMVFPDSMSPAVPQGVGAGPFILKSVERGTSLDFEANPHYYKPGLPKLKGVRLVVYADENLRVAALRSGDLDLIEYVPWQSMGAIEADPNLVLQVTEGPFMFLQFNGKSGPLGDKRVRQAIGHSIKREEVVKAAFFGRGSPMAGLPIVHSSPFFDPALSNGQAYDPAKAKQLLTEAGFPNGFSTSLLSTATYGMHKDTAEVIQQNLAAMGIQVELRLPDWATRVAQGNRGQYDMAVQGTAAESNDPDGITNQIDGTLGPSYGRSANIPTPRVHELLAQGRAEFDPVKRRAIYDELQKVSLDEANFVGIAWRAQGYAFSKDLKGFTNLPGALTFFSGATLDGASLS
jgi:peptide/nickel transport system substrate-binding protein